MISAEEKQYYLEMDCTEEEYRSKQSLMKGRLQFLKEKRETERKQFVLEKMDQKFRFLNLKKLVVDINHYQNLSG